jgi:hypothetical protein
VRGRGVAQDLDHRRVPLAVQAVEDGQRLLEVRLGLLGALLLHPHASHGLERAGRVGVRLLVRRLVDLGDELVRPERLLEVLHALKEGGELLVLGRDLGARRAVALHVAIDGAHEELARGVMIVAQRLDLREPRDRVEDVFMVGPEGRLLDTQGAQAGALGALQVAARNEEVGEVVEDAREEERLRAFGILEEGERALEAPRGGFAVAHGGAERGEVVERGGQAGVLGSEGRFGEGDRALEDREGEGERALGLIDGSEAREHGREGRARRAVARIGEAEGALQGVLGAGGGALLERVDDAEVVERGDEVRVVAAVELLGDGERSAEEPLRPGQVAPLAVEDGEAVQRLGDRIALVAIEALAEGEALLAEGLGGGELAFVGEEHLGCVEDHGERAGIGLACGAQDVERAVEERLDAAQGAGPALELGESDERADERRCGAAVDRLEGGDGALEEGAAAIVRAEVGVHLAKVAGELGDVGVVRSELGLADLEEALGGGGGESGLAGPLELGDLGRELEGFVGRGGVVDRRVGGAHQGGMMRPCAQRRQEGLDSDRDRDRDRNRDRDRDRDRDRTKRAAGCPSPGVPWRESHPR